MSPARVAAEAHPLIGQRVRMESKAAPGGRVVGTVTSVDPDAVRLTTEAGTALALPYRSVDKVEVSGGEGSRMSEGAGIGFIVGAGLGYAVSAANPGALRWGSMTQPEANLVGAAIFAPIVGFIGAAIGSRHKAERWQKVQWRGVTFDIRPLPAGLVVTARW
jgi:hypothetical protein